jgi:hypothetical protein
VRAKRSETETANLRNLQKIVLPTFAILTGLVGPTMAQEKIRISSDWGSVTADLTDNAATRALVKMLPVTLDMRDHLRQEKTGNLPADLPEIKRQLGFSAGSLGLWSGNHFVIYYKGGEVPEPGIIPLGKVEGDVSLFNRPGPVTIKIDHMD